MYGVHLFGDPMTFTLRHKEKVENTQQDPFERMMPNHCKITVVEPFVTKALFPRSLIRWPLSCPVLKKK